MKLFPARRGWLSYGTAWLAVLLAGWCLAFGSFGLTISLRLLVGWDFPTENQRVVDVLDQSPDAFPEAMDRLRGFCSAGLATIEAFGKGWWKYTLPVVVLLCVSSLCLPQEGQAPRRWALRALAVASLGVLLGAGVSALSRHAHDTRLPPAGSQRLGQYQTRDQRADVLRSSRREARTVGYSFVGICALASLQSGAVLFLAIAAAFPNRRE